MGIRGKNKAASQRSMVADILRQHPDGLTTYEISRALQPKLAIEHRQVINKVCDLVRIGLINKIGRRNCPCCGRAVMYYGAAKHAA